MQLLTRQLRPRDRVAMVVYAGASGLVLDSTRGNEQDNGYGGTEFLQAVIAFSTAFARLQSPVTQE